MVVTIAKLHSWNLKDTHIKNVTAEFKLMGL